MILIFPGQNGKLLDHNNERINHRDTKKDELESFVPLWLISTPCHRHNGQAFSPLHIRRDNRVVYGSQERLNLEKLQQIGNIKNLLPFSQRDWCNSLGLFVQFRATPNLSRVQAGGKYHSQIDAWEEGSSVESGLEWKVKKYEPGDWEKLVDPTLEIAIWLMLHEGLPEEYMERDLLV